MADGAGRIAEFTVSKYEDRTDPYDVKARRHRRESHDHRNGICELIAEPDRVGWKDGECNLECNWYDPEMRCSCAMCSMGMKEEGRRKRYDGRRQARDWWREYL